MPLSMHSGRRNEPFNEKKGALDYDTTGRRSEKEKRPPYRCAAIWDLSRRRQVCEVRHKTIYTMESLILAQDER
jgi:hypothetical protein